MQNIKAQVMIFMAGAVSIIHFGSAALADPNDAPAGKSGAFGKTRGAAGISRQGRTGPSVG